VSIRRLPSGTWQARWPIAKDPLTGTVREITATAPNKRAARLAEGELQAKAQRWRSDERTVDDLLDRWLQHLHVLVRAGSRSPTTLRGYEDKARRIRALIGHHQVTDVDGSTIDALYRRLLEDGVSPATVAHIHRVVHAAFGQAVKWQWVDRNPADAASPPRARAKRVEPPLAAQVLAILDEASRRSPDLYLALRLAAVTGARRGEVCALRWTDVDGAVVTIARSVAVVGGRVVEKETKTGAVRKVVVDEETANLLVGQQARQEQVAARLRGKLRADGFVIANLHGDVTGGRGWYPDSLTTGFARCAEAVGVKAHLHLLRHFHASLLLESGLSFPQVAARLGHSSPQVTARVYAHVLDSPDAGAVAAVTKALGR
jgi:integrase